MTTKQPDKNKFHFSKIECVGIMAGLFAFIGGLIQLFHTYNKKKADDISYIFIIGAIASAILWVIYHYRKRGGGALIITLVTLIGFLVLLIMKLVFEYKKDKKDKNS